MPQTLFLSSPIDFPNTIYNDNKHMYINKADREAFWKLWDSWGVEQKVFNQSEHYICLACVVKMRPRPVPANVKMPDFTQFLL